MGGASASVDYGWTARARLSNVEADATPPGGRVALAGPDQAHEREIAADERDAYGNASRGCPRASWSDGLPWHRDRRARPERAGGRRATDRQLPVAVPEPHREVRAGHPAIRALHRATRARDRATRSRDHVTRARHRATRARDHAARA